MGNSSSIGTVLHHSACQLTIEDSPWSCSTEHAEAIHNNWQKQQLAKPRLFNGTVHVLKSPWATSNAVFHAQFMRTDFKTYLYWRENTDIDPHVLDGFGSALIRSKDGYVLLGCQSAGHLNAGLSYLPGGFIDERDVNEDGTIDIEASVAREIEEETGLRTSDIVRVPGFVITAAEIWLSIGVTYQSDKTAAQLQTTIDAHLARDRDPEFSHVTFVRDQQDLERVTLPRYAEVLLHNILPEKRDT